MYLLIIYFFCCVTRISGLLMPMTKPDGSVDQYSMVSHLTLTEHTLAGLQTKFDYMEKEMETTREELHATKSELRLTKTELSKTSTELNRTRAELQKTTVDLQNATMELHMIKTDLNGKKQLPDSEIRIIKDELSDVKRKHDLASNEISSLKTSLQTWQSQINSNISSLRQEVTDWVMTSDEVSTMKSQLNTLTKQYLSLKTQYNTSVTDSISHDVTSNTADIMALKADVLVVKKIIGISNTSVETCVTEVNNVKENLSKFSKSLGREQIILKNDILNMSVILNQTQRNLASTTNVVSDVQSNVKTMETHINTATHEITAVASNVSSLRVTVSGLEMTSHNNSQTLGQLSQTLDRRAKNIAFHAFVSDSGPTGRGRPIQFNRVNYNAGKGYSATTGKFTAPVSATYLFTVQVEMYGPNQDTYVRIINGRNLISEGVGRSSTDINDVMIPVTGIAYIKQGEDVWVMSRSDVNVYGGGATHFAGAMLSVD